MGLGSGVGGFEGLGFRGLRGFWGLGLGVWEFGEQVPDLWPCTL